MRKSVTTLAFVFALGSVAGQGRGTAPAGPPSDLRYDRDVRPLLADRCFRCHGGDPAARRAELRLDGFDTATAAREHGAPIVPGKPDASELWRRITTDDEDDAMPPKSSGKARLNDSERAIVRAWIEQGAVYEPHWSFAPPARPALPEVRDAGWCRSEIDRFVVALLERRGVTPNPEADRATLLRRLFLTVTGLPPTPEELDAFLADATTDAYERMVDRLLTTEPYVTRHAEHMAVPWLDAARYADTCGIHMDAGRQMWAWRDWLLAAYRDNLPFDRFVVEQLAGDLLPEATLQQKVASGFNRNHVTTDEGGAIDEEYRVEYAVDRTATTGSVFLGLTVGCARCHSHKYDPVSHEDFYRLYAYFNSNEEPGLYSQVPDANRALEPFLAVPSPKQQQEQQALQQDLAAARLEVAAPIPEEEAQQAAFVQQLWQRAGVQWPATTPIAASSDHGATMSIEPDGSVKASGENPPKDVHQIRLRTEGESLRLLSLQALPDPSFAEGRVGRAANGNAVLQSLQVEAFSIADPSQHRPVALCWAWADVEQSNSDFAVVNALRDDDGAGWAVDAHSHPAAARTALFVAAEPFGYPGGTEVLVTLRYDSKHSQHTFGRVRLQLGAIADAGLELLPEARGRWFMVGPFAAGSPEEAWDKACGPEAVTHLDYRQEFTGTEKDKRWRVLVDAQDGQVNRLPDGVSATYVSQRVLSPTARARTLSLGSDDGFRLFLDGVEVAGNKIDRGAQADQDKAETKLAAGSHLLTLKIVNTGGPGGFYVRRLPRDDELAGDLVFSLLSPDAAAPLQERIRTAWRLGFSPGYAQRVQRVAALEKELAALDKSIPRTMVMQEMATPRTTYVLTRGEYDKPDKKRPVTRGIPAALGKLPDGAPDNRLGLAQWLVAADNPLFARVQMNRLWEQVFGTGIVRTTEDFGMQGEWPSHPELLDWLAVEFRERGFDVRAMLRLLLHSATFRQAAVARAEVRERDPENRWLAWFPRRRLAAEQLRDQALYLGGLLVERLGGPSVKPPQPEGLWQEVAMTQSNTRIYQPGTGDDLYRRSLYTYWKRACPPPNMLTLDAPTREFCNIRRTTTNTPLQALVLWNDGQFVDAARALAERTLRLPGDDRARIDALFVRCTGKAPSAPVRERALATLQTFRGRYGAAADAAKELAAASMRPVPQDLPAAELAAFTLLASALLNLDATLCTP